MNRTVIASFLEVVGAAVFLGGLVLVSWPLAVVALGAFLILAALAIQKVGY